MRQHRIVLDYLEGKFAQFILWGFRHRGAGWQRTRREPGLARWNFEAGSR